MNLLCSWATMSEAKTATPSGAGGGRLLALDALRGFDMFWIVGAEKIVDALHKVSDNGLVGGIATQLTHKKWEGVAFYDLIFPLFVFIAGASLVFSLGKAIEQDGRASACLRVVRRGLLLWVIGIIYYGGMSKGFENIRLLGVLQRIGLAYLFAGLIFCNFRLRGIIACLAGLLIGYWLVMSFVPVPGVGAGHFEEGANLANYVDKQYLPFRKWDGDHDPEGLLSTLPAIATCLLGVLAGLLLKNGSIPPHKKVVILLAGGAASVALGFLWGFQFPVIKKIWTSSYVLVAGGYAAIFLAVFYQVIEIWRLQKWAQPFVWIGMNPLTIYLAFSIIDFENLATRFVGGEIYKGLGAYGDVTVTILALLFALALARFLYQRRIFLRL